MCYRFDLEQSLETIISDIITIVLPEDIDEEGF